MNNNFMKMINDIDFLYGFIYECANLIIIYTIMVIMII